MRLLLLVLGASVALATTYHSVAQGQARPGALWDADSIVSSVLGETRALRIALPRNYNAPWNRTERFGVLIVLDAQSDLHFNAAVANAQGLATAVSPAIPGLIIVGVETNAPKRYHDLSPPQVGTAPPSPGAGGAVAFLRFLQTELAPYFATRYRTLPMTVIVGGSMSGLFAAWAYGQAPDFITAAIALSPSLQEYDDYPRMVIHGAQQRTRRGWLFMLSGANESPSMDSTTRVVAAALAPQTSLPTAFHYEQVAGASHYNTGLPGVISGLQFVFRSVSLAGTKIEEMNRRATPAEWIAMFDDIRTRYANGARELGLPERLPPGFLINRGVFFDGPGAAWARAQLHVCQVLATTYPAIWHGYECSGDAQARAGDTRGAATNYEAALAAALRLGDARAVSNLRQKREQVRVP